jgi:hypothetical protein
LGTVGVVAVYLLLRPDTSTGRALPVGVVSPFAQEPQGSSPFSPAAPPAAPAQAPSAAVQPSSPAPLLPSSSPLPPERSGSPSGGPIFMQPPAVKPAPAAAEPSPEAPPARAPLEEGPTATFAAAARVEIGPPAAPAPAAAKEKPPAAPAPAAKRPQASRAARRETRERRAEKRSPQWVFEGVAFDLLTAQGVFAARLTFLDSQGNVVARVETGPEGRYRIALPPAGKDGYRVQVSRTDYTSRYIDEGDATSSLREATPDERRILMQAASRNLPWIGKTSGPTRRDLALIPRHSDD